MRRKPSAHSRRLAWPRFGKVTIKLVARKGSNRTTIEEIGEFSSRLYHLRESPRSFVGERVRTNPSLSRFSNILGEAGLYLAANDVLYRLDILNLTFVLSVISMLRVYFWSFTAGTLFIGGICLGRSRRCVPQ